MMNQKAEELGLTNTHFENCTGLHNDNHYSTCRDIAVLMSECLKSDTFREIVTRRFTQRKLPHHTRRELRCMTRCSTGLPAMR